MANGLPNQEGVPENLRNQLAVAVRSIQWSYAIFWSLSTTQQGVLEWGDGYYNGDIKTRKTVQSTEYKSDKRGLLRSQQLRELYESLLEGKTDEQSRRHSAALSPEDLTDAEWYYLVCMSFVFKLGEGLPGRAITNGKPIWLCNAHCADSKVFSRSLLAKSASIQTVVCFPHFGGVTELGVIELVLEDPNIIQHIKASFLEYSKPVCSEKSSSLDNTHNDKDGTCARVDLENVDIMALDCYPAEDIKFDQEGPEELNQNVYENFAMDSPDEREESFMLEGINGEAFQVQSQQFKDDEFSNHIQDSMNYRHHISQTFVNQEKGISPTKSENVKNLPFKELQECNLPNITSLDLGNNDKLHYRRTLSSILRASHWLVDNLCFQSSDCKSSFLSWKKGGTLDGYRPLVQQRMLKKILFNIPLMHGNFSLKHPKENGGGKDWLWRQESDEICLQHALPDKRAENEKFLVLRSMVPSISKIDKTSILDDAIAYLKELEARVENLESCLDLVESEAIARMKCPELLEQISDNYENRRTGYGKEPWMNKRKAHDIDDIDPEMNSIDPKDELPLDMKVGINDKQVFIEMRCIWREYLLLDIIDAINNLSLDAHSVQSSIVNGILTVSLQSKVQGAAVASASMIKQAIWKVAGKC